MLDIVAVTEPGIELFPNNNKPVDPATVPQHEYHRFNDNLSRPLNLENNQEIEVSVLSLSVPVFGRKMLAITDTYLNIF